MLLTIDIGYTRIGYGLFDGGVLVRHGRVSSGDARALTDAVGEMHPARIVLASVAPSVTDKVIAHLASTYQESVAVAGRDIPYGIDIQCEHPERVGADRLLNAIAAHKRIGGAAIVADVGTAVTVDMVSARGSFCGGAIAPGPEMMLRAMHEFTELLPEIHAGPKPKSPLGHNTTAAMHAGAYWGSVGLVERLIQAIHDDQREALPVLVTGGAGQSVARELAMRNEYVETLTLEGLAVLAGT